MKALSFARRRLLETLSGQTDPITTWAVFNGAFADYSTGRQWVERKTDKLNRMARHGWIERAGSNRQGELLWRITPAGEARLTADPQDTRRHAA